MKLEEILEELVGELKLVRRDLAKIGEENKLHFQEWREKNLK